MSTNRSARSSSNRPQAARTTEPLKSPPARDIPHPTSPVEAEDFASTAFCSGYGQYHSADSESEQTRRSYVAVTFTAVIERMKTPQNVPKSAAQWAIFSTHPSRKSEEQRQQGRFHVLAVDLDRAPPPVKDASLRIANLVRSDVFTYTTRSAKRGEQKSRTLIPLATPVEGRRYELLQKCLNDRLEAGGLNPDRATERAAQLHFLPNRGEYYTTAMISGRPGKRSSDCQGGRAGRQGGGPPPAPGRSRPEVEGATAAPAADRRTVTYRRLQGSLLSA